MNKNSQRSGLVGCINHKHVLCLKIKKEKENYIIITFTPITKFLLGRT